MFYITLILQQVFTFFFFCANCCSIPTVDAATYSTDICKKERNGTTQKLVFRKVDAAELDSLLRWSKVDAFFSLEVYDYLQSAGIRLVANRLVVNSR